MPDHSESHLSRFQALSTLLGDNSDLWRCRPFVDEPPWAAQETALTAFLDTLPTRDLDAAQGSDEALRALLRPALPDLCDAIEQHCRLAPAVPVDAGPEIPHVPGRKLQQINAFCAALNVPRNAVEWCSGKAHLGRAIYRQHGAAVTALEIDPALVEAGNALSQKEQARVTSQVCDVLTPSARDYLGPNTHALALHACGGLHSKLLNDAVACGVPAISWSPCCYHKFQRGQFEPLSGAAAQSGLALTLEEVRGAVRQNSTAGLAEKNRHRLHQVWKLGFDTLQRQLRRRNEYLALPPIKALGRAENFEDFCHRAAMAKGLELPTSVDFRDIESRGQQRYARIARQELVRELFRRPLELWLVLDQILFLEENGFECRLKQFCEVTLTPRNLLIDAWRV